MLFLQMYSSNKGVYCIYRCFSYKCILRIRESTVYIDAFPTNVFFELVSSSNTWYDIISLVNEMGIDICKALPFFFAYTGSDTVSTFHSKGKCTLKDELTRTFIKLGHFP